MLLDPALLGMLGILLVLGALAWWRGGGDMLRSGLAGGLSLLGRFSLLLVVSFLAAGLAEVLVPRAWVEGALGRDSGLLGICLASVGGALVPSGPFVAIPLAAVLHRSGAATGPLVAFVAGWGLLAIHRLVAWEIPILGARFALLRWSVSLALPVVAGLLARALARS